MRKKLNEDRYDGRMPVNVYTGRFQPFHLGHLNNLREAAKRGLRTVICPVMAGKTAKSIAAHPFNGKIEEEMFNRLKVAYGDLIADIIPIARPSLDCWVEAIRERGMEPISWTTGTDQLPAYRNMVEKYGPDFNLVDDFEVIGLNKDTEGENWSADNTGDISATLVRGNGKYAGKCLGNPDKEAGRKEFESVMPECLYPMFDEMRRILYGDEEPAKMGVYEGLMRDMEYRRYRKSLDEAITRLVKKTRKDIIL